MRFLAGVLLLVSFLATARAGDVPEGMEPVPPELLKIRTLVLEAGNCSVEAPYGWEWFVSSDASSKHPELRVFYCRSPQKDEMFVLQVYEAHAFSLDQKGMEEFLTGMRGTLAKQSWGFQGETKSAASRVPVPDGSFHFSMTLIRDKDKAPVYWMGYVAAADKMYCLTSMRMNEGESSEFTSFAKSFKLLKPVSPPSRLGGFVQLAVISLCVGTVTALISQRRLKAKEAAAAEAPSEDDESDETDAFKPTPIVPSKSRSKGRSTKPAPEEKPRTRPRETPEKDRGRTRADPRSRPEEKRPKREERPFG